MARSSAVAGLATLALCACSSQSPADFDHGHGPQGGGDGDTYGTGSARLTYPAPPYGSVVNSTIENFHFLGWSDPQAAGLDTSRLEDLQLARFYDPDGTKGVKLLVITSTAVWCSACKIEYRDLASDKAKSYRDKGVEFLGALFEDNNNNPAKPSDLENWAKSYGVDFYFVLDPSLKFGNFFDREATPMEMVIDAKTMQVLFVATGWGPDLLWSELDAYLGG